MEILGELSTSLNSGFIDSNLASFQQYNPRLLINDFKRGMKDIDNYVKSLNNDIKNIMILCPNHLSIIHDVNPQLD